MAASKHPRPRSGYAFFSDSPGYWEEMRNDDWETGVFSGDDMRGAKYLGDRVIDGTRVHVWIQRGGARYIAQTAVGHNPISTGGKVAIGAGIVAILAAIFWPKSASAATSPTPTPTPKPPPSSDPPVDPPVPPPPAPTPPASKVPTAGPQPIDFSTIPAPTGTGVRAVVWEWGTYAQKGQEWQQLSSVDIADLTLVALDLKALFAQLTAYKPFPPPYQAVHLYPYSFGAWLPSWQSFSNYDTVKGGTEWSWVRVWQWTGTQWTMQSETGPQSSAVPAATLANAIKDLSAPPYLVSQAFRWSASTQAWSLAASAKNW